MPYGTCWKQFSSVMRKYPFEYLRNAKADQNAYSHRSIKFFIRHYINNYINNLGTNKYTAELRWPEHRWLVHRGYFKLVLQSLGKNPLDAEMG